MKKTLLLLITLLILQVFHSCKKQYSTSELKANFTTEQIAELNEIREFFKKEICDSDFKTCYEKTNHDSLQANGVGIWTKIDFNEQKKLYKKISESTFNEIWMFCETTYYPKKIKAKSICAVATGNYQNYLADLGKKNPRIAKYAEKIEASGDFSLFDEHSIDISDSLFSN